MTAQGVISTAVNWAISIAHDDRHGYDMNRQKGDYDCSSFLIEAYERAGVPVKEAGASFTGNMREAFKKCGFIEVPISSRKKGDILLNEKHHTAMMINDYDIVHASINEKGTTTGGQVGDQTGKEICIRPYYNHKYGWDCCLRYNGTETPTIAPVKPSNVIIINLPIIKRGDISEAVRSLQILLNAKHNADIVPDGDFGLLTENALKDYQRAKKLEADGVAGAKTWTTLLNE